MVTHHLRVAYLHVVHLSAHLDAHELITNPTGAGWHGMVCDLFIFPEVVPGKVVLFAAHFAHQWLQVWLEGER